MFLTFERKELTGVQSVTTQSRLNIDKGVLFCVYKNLADNWKIISLLNKITVCVEGLLPALLEPWPFYVAKLTQPPFPTSRKSIN